MDAATIAKELRARAEVLRSKGAALDTQAGELYKKYSDLSIEADRCNHKAASLEATCGVLEKMAIETPANPGADPASL